MPASGHVGHLSVLIGGSGEELRTELKKSGKDVKEYVKGANQEFEKLGKPAVGPKDEGFGSPPEASGRFGDFAKWIKKQQAESRKSGEKGLARVLSEEGLGEAGLQALGLGVQGIVVDKLGEAFSKSSEAAKSLATGESSPREFVNQLAGGLPVLGEWIKGWSTVLSLVDGTAKEEAELNQQIKANATVGRSIASLTAARADALSVRAPSDFERESLGIENERRKRASEIGESRSQLGEQEIEAQDRAMSWKEYAGKALNRIGSAENSFTNSILGTHYEDKPVVADFNENDDQVQEAMKPFETAIANKNKEQEVNDKIAATRRQRLVEESLEQMDKSIASSRLGQTMAVGGNPEAILAARQAVSRANTEALLKPMDREMSDNAAAIKAGTGLNGLSLEQVKSRQEKLTEQRKATAADGEAEITRMAKDETKRRTDSLFNIEMGMEDQRVSIMRSNSKSAESQVQADLAGLKANTERQLGAIDDRLADPSIGGEERKKLMEQRAMTEKAGAAAADKLQQDEAKRRAAALIDIEHEIAKNRLSILAANAHDVESIWAVTEGGIKEQAQEQLDAIDKKLKELNLSEAERNKLIQERKSIIATEDAQLKRAKEDFDRETRRAQQGNAGTLLGVASNLLSDRQGLYGGNNAAAIREQRKLGAMGQILSMRQQIESVLAPDSRADDAQKAAAKQALGALGDWQKYALSDKNLNQMPYVPLRHAAGEEANAGYSGAAEYQTESDANDYAKSSNMIDEQKETNRLLDLIAKMMSGGGGNGASNPLFPH